MNSLHFLCRFQKRMDATGRIYYSATLANSRLLIYPTDDGELLFYLGQQIMENKSLQDDRRGTNSNPFDRMDGMK